jgi:tRNA(Ile)-lysidine synthase TilS/MesJ
VEVETAAYGFLKGIDYVTEECPMSEDATSLVYKEALSRIEDRMPGTRIVFYKGFLDPSNPLRKGPADAEEDGGTARACAACGAPTYAETCSYCRMKERVRNARELRAARVAR